MYGSIWNTYTGICQFFRSDGFYVFLKALTGPVLNVRISEGISQRYKVLNRTVYTGMYVSWGMDGHIWWVIQVWWPTARIRYGVVRLLDWFYQGGIVWLDMYPGCYFFFLLTFVLAKNLWPFACFVHYFFPCYSLIMSYTTQSGGGDLTLKPLSCINNSYVLIIQEPSQTVASFYQYRYYRGNACIPMPLQKVTPKRGHF